ncbi:hypothetical protein O181_009808 [Austropuccinia psidii MF-1]|uniref:DUF3752 domain-containing protein n=1 Tax=Austropuccinia psidii MF-1 TaxID=1389203 RepID=A0A9Q3GJS4_9BASI|nr:hypothetical protein [Austropuccinia psidii MF-1]
MASIPIIGPTLPPHLRLSCESKSESQPSNSNDDSIPVSSVQTQPSKSNSIIGPALPPGFSRSSGPEVSYNIDDEDLSDDQIGPTPLLANAIHKNRQENEGVTALREREERRKERERIEKESKVLKREEWMLLPPKELDLKSSIDPTKLKSRGFKQNSKPYSSSQDQQTCTGTLWTETPVERAQRLADEAIGKRRRAEDVTKTNDEDDLEKVKRKKRDKVIRNQVEQHNQSSRNASLLQLHNQSLENTSKSKSAAEKEAEKKQAVVWDHDTMMGVGGKLLGEREKNSMIRDAKALGGRFGGSSFL